MKLRLEEKQRARQLRLEGYSYGEIQALLPGVSKSTLSGWLRGIALSEAQRSRLIKKMRASGAHGRQKGALANQVARQKRIALAYKTATDEFPLLMKQSLFPLGLILYSAEGSKTQEMFQFINSNPDIIQMMLKWLTETCGVSRTQIRARVYAHKIYEDQNPQLFWQEVTALPLEQFRNIVYKPTPHTRKKNPAYMGCCRLDVLGTEFFWKIKTWQDLLFAYHLRSRGEMDITADFGSAIGGSSPSESANAN